MKIKTFITAFIIGLNFQSLSAKVETLSLTFESGSLSIDAAHCWGFPDRGFSYSANDAEVLSGDWTGRTRQLNAPKDIYIKSPWMHAAAGNVTFQLRFTNKPEQNRGIEISYIPVDESASDKEGTPVLFYSKEFSDTPTSLQSISAAIPAAIVDDGNSYRIKINFVGKGGSERALIDNLVIPGTYNSDPSKGCRPLTAVVTDQDGDGVEDADDDYPADRYKAFDNYFPSSSAYGTLWFEDQWPSKGDYDFNDLVLGYRVNTVTNAAGKVVEQNYTYIIRAIGAAYRNGFGFQLMNVSPAAITRVTGTNVSSGYTFSDNGLESGQTHATVIVFDNPFRFMGSPSAVVNTDPSLAYLTPYTLNVKVVFIENGVTPSGGSVTLNQLTLDKFNPFLIVSGDRGREVHLPNFKPTDLANNTLFGTGNDASVPAGNKYYITANNLPWGLNIPYEVKYPIEKKEITSGYLKFIDWVLSGGVNYSDWYLDLAGYRNNQFLYD